MQLTALLFMGGYGIYIWPAYLITFLIFFGNIFFTLRAKKEIKKLIRNYYTQS